MALIWILREIAASGYGRLAGLIHVNHRLRGAEADGDEAFCRELADRLGLRIEVARRDTRGLARRRHVSLEAAGRAARYAFFATAARRLQADVVATGHTADDQAETVLMRLFRGAGARGLGAIRPRRGLFVRPLLDVRRHDLRRYLADRQLSFREDASNLDTSILRNRLRQELMPVIERISPAAVQSLVRAADLARDDEAFLSAAARDRVGAADARLDVATLAQLPAALGRRVIMMAAARAVPRVSLSATHVEAVRRLAAADKPVGRLTLPGLSVERAAGQLTFAPPRRAAARFEHPLPVPGCVQLAGSGDEIVAIRADSVNLDELGAPEGQRAVVQADAVETPFVVRSRRPGDRFRPLGAPGRRKIQDLFVDRKVPRQARDRVPIVVDARGRIVWVAGLAVADECRVTAPRAGVVILELKK